MFFYDSLFTKTTEKVTQFNIITSCDPAFFIDKFYRVGLQW